jgi:hypothetical protein
MKSNSAILKHSEFGIRRGVEQAITIQKKRFDEFCLVGAGPTGVGD